MESTPETQADPRDEEIALTAYRIWLREGCPHGQDREHWLRARDELRARGESENQSCAEACAGEPGTGG